MENDESEPDAYNKALDELEDAAKDIPYWQRKKDPYVHKKVAEAKAIEDGDSSKENVERQLQLMDEEDREYEVRKAISTEKRYQLFGWLLLVVGLGTAVVGTIVSNYIPISVVGVVMLVTGFVLNRTGINKQTKRLENLPPDSEK